MLVIHLTLCNVQAKPVQQKVQEINYITYLPYIIDRPGVYILVVNWYANTSISPDQSLIEIMSSDVILYGNNKVLRGDSTLKSKCLYIHDVGNVTIYMPIIENWKYGVLVINCHDVFVFGNASRIRDVKNATVHVERSTHTLLVDLALTNDSRITFYDSSHAILINLSLTNNSGIVFQRSFENEVVNCTLDNKPIIYYEGLTDLDITNIDFGQLIVVNCSNVVIRELELVSSAITLIEVSSVEDCFITNVMITKGGGGILLIETNNCTITHCTITNVGTALECRNSRNVVINNIGISNARVGIDLSSLKDFIITNSTISNCDEAAICSYYSEDGYIYLNDFIGNVKVLHVPDVPYQAMRNVTWHSPDYIVYKYGGSVYVNYLGNYYSDYMGYDEDGDGIGEDPYRLYEGGFVIYDNYPLIASKAFYYIIPEERDLSRVPGIFIANGVFNTTFIVGDTYRHKHTGFRAATADVIGAIRIAESFRGVAESSYVEAYVDTYVSDFVDGSVVVYWEKIKTPTIICIGGPGVNYLTYKYNGTYPFVWRYIHNVKSYIYSEVSGIKYERNSTHDYAIIALVEDHNRYILIVWGLTRNGTQAACIALQNYSEFSDILKGRAVIIAWTDSNSNGIPDKDDRIMCMEKWP